MFGRNKSSRMADTSSAARNGATTTSSSASQNNPQLQQQARPPVLDAAPGSSFNPQLYYQTEVRDRNERSIAFVVPHRYRDLSFINAGAQGTVALAHDRVTGKKVAIKKMQQSFVTPIHAKRTYREFMLLTSIKHPNIIQLLSAYSPQSTLEEFNELYVVMEFMHYSLHDVRNRMALEHRMLSWFIYQMLVGVRHLHVTGIIHRDLKPVNIVANDGCVVKILDFGLARKVQSENVQLRMSDYVVTRYYRAPEVILGMGYDGKVDIWSIGCIVAELVLRRILFPGQDRIDQWTKITDKLGSPSDLFIAKLEPAVARYVQSLPQRVGQTMEQILPDSAFQRETELPDRGVTAANCRDLVTKMLAIDPEKRISIDDAIAHPYVALWYRDDEVNAPPSASRYDPQMDFATMTLAQWKELIFREVQRFQNEHDVFGRAETL